jgi:hypothetical protein
LTAGLALALRTGTVQGHYVIRQFKVVSRRNFRLAGFNDIIHKFLDPSALQANQVIMVFTLV